MQAAGEADEPEEAMREAARPASLVEKKMNKRMKQEAVRVEATGKTGGLVEKIIRDAHKADEPDEARRAKRGSTMKLVITVGLFLLTVTVTAESIKARTDLGSSDGPSPSGSSDASISAHEKYQRMHKLASVGRLDRLAARDKRASCRRRHESCGESYGECCRTPYSCMSCAWGFTGKGYCAIDMWSSCR